MSTNDQNPAKRIKLLNFTILKNVLLPRGDAEHLSHELYNAVEFEGKLFYQIIRKNYFLDCLNNWLSMDGAFLSSSFGWLKPMKTRLHPNGRAQIQLKNNGGKQKGSNVARWVCLLFCDVPERHKDKELDDLQASHIVNHNGSNDCAENLLWETLKENKARETGTKNPKLAATKSREVIITALNGTRSETFDSVKDAAKAIWADPSKLSMVANGKRNKTFAKTWNLWVRAAWNDIVPNGTIVKVDIDFSHGITIPESKPWFVTTNGKHIKTNKQNWTPVRGSDQLFRTQGKHLTIYQIMAGTILGRIHPDYPQEYSMEWLLEQGEDRKMLSVDHINGDHADNRIENLRWATKKTQSSNMKSNVSVKVWPVDRDFNKETDVFNRIAEAARNYGVSRGGLSKALLRGQKTYKPKNSSVNYFIEKV